MILHKIVRLKLYGSDLYGRILADVYINDDESSLTETLLQNKYYKKVNFFSYRGYKRNKKISEPSELLEHVIRKKNTEFRRDGYSPMSSYHKKQLQDYLTKNPNAEPLELNDNSYGVICCVKTNNLNDPLIATIRMCNASNYLSLPKGHREKSESDVESAIRETREEIGIDASKYIHPNLYTNIKYTFVYPMYNHEWKLHKEYPDESKRPFCVCYKEVKFFLAVFPEILELKPQPKEVLECKWNPLSTFKKETSADYSKMITDFFKSKNVKSKLHTAHASDSTFTTIASSKNKTMLPMFLEKVLKKNNQSKPKPQFNILDRFYLFNKKKSSEPSNDEQLQEQNKKDEPLIQTKKLFGFLKK
jgi:8-oxo-dGTP pyrophosphatase MutT (NUDIX family)